MKKLTARIFTTLLLTFSLVFGAPLSTPVYADENTPEQSTVIGDGTEEEPEEENTDDDSSETESTEETAETTSEEGKNLCADQTGVLSWMVCPSSGVIANAIDSLYNAISDLLEVQPLSMEDSSPIYLVWQYARNITNIVFIIFLLIVIYSQLTGIGLSNYGVKRVLPRLIIAVVLVNLSFLICSLAVDVSNIVGSDLRDFFGGIQEMVIENAAANPILSEFTFSGVLASVISGAAIVGVAAGVVGGAGYLFFMLLVVLIGAIISVVTGLITIAARQALVALLVMISPLAFVSYLLPNTEKWFTKWKDLLVKMLIFYPTFSFLFGASELVGYALMASATSDMGVILGLAVQVFPLFFSWSLMKMSGTILGTLNSGLRQLASPVQKGLGGWALSHAEQHRQHYLANSTAPGAKLRRYLDYRRELRETDTANSANIRKGKAIESSMRTAAAIKGYDKDGNLVYGKPNRYTSNAKLGSTYETRAKTAQSAYKNALSSYGRNFSKNEYDASRRLATFAARSFEDAKAQEYLTANEAENDQKELLDAYLDAINTRDTNPYKFNRLVGSAAGGLDYLGEASIMGQVIVGNSNIENRRRAEARIMITKFGIQKPQFRAMVFDKEHINDNGFVEDEYGNVIEDDQYHLKSGKSYTPWQHYIYVHKKSNTHITKEEYGRLSAGDQDQYRRVRYMDILDDKGNPVQRVYDDDAGYMKELLSDDVAIGDPINKRYLTEIGVTADRSSMGMLRKYHSTISAAMLTTKYKEHNGAVTPMLTAQTNMGYVTTPGQYNIGELQSLNVATKPGPLLQNDAIFLKNWASILSTMTDHPIDPDKPFEYYFPDEDIMTYRNVNGLLLKGLREGTDDNGNPTWKEVGYAEMDTLTPEQQLEYRKNYVKHNILHKAAKKLIGATNRRLSPTILENQKPDTLEALVGLVEVLQNLGRLDADTDTGFTTKLNGGYDKNGQRLNLFDSQDPGVLQSMINDIKRELERRENGEAPTSTTTITGTTSGANNGGRPQTTADFTNEVFRMLAERLNRLADAEAISQRGNDTTEIILNLDDLLNSGATDLNTAISFVQSILEQIDQNDPRYDGLSQIITTYQTGTPPMTTEESIEQGAAFLREVRDYLDRYGYND